MRTCVVGRDEHPREALLRLVASPDGEVVVDFRGNLPGRGAWILPEAERLALLPRRAGALASALGLSPDRVDGARVASAIRDSVAAGVLDGLSIAAAAGVLIRGQERLGEALARGVTALVGVASDASERTVARLRAASPEALFVPVPFEAAVLGARVGEATVAVFGVPSSAAAGALRRQLRRLSRLG